MGPNRQISSGQVKIKRGRSGLHDALIAVFAWGGGPGHVPSGKFETFRLSWSVSSTFCAKISKYLDEQVTMLELTMKKE